MPYGSWMRATTQTERGKLNWSRERFNRDQHKSKTNVAETNIPNPIGTGQKQGEGTDPMVINHENEVTKEQLMLSAVGIENPPTENKCTGRETIREQDGAAGNDSYSWGTSVQVGNENWREREAQETMDKVNDLEGIKNTDEGPNKSDVKAMGNGPNKIKPKPKGRKWKLQAWVQKLENMCDNGPVSVKRPSNEIKWPSPGKRQNLNSPAKQLQNYSQISQPRAQLQLQLRDEEQAVGMDPETYVENLSAGADNQPRRQP